MPSINGFQSFYETLTAYRRSFLLINFADSGLAEFISAGSGSVTLEEIARFLQIPPEKAERLAAGYADLGCLIKKNGNNNRQPAIRYALSSWGEQLFSSKSDSNQLAALRFEKRIMEKWSTIGLKNSEADDPSALIKSETRYRNDLDEFLSAMDCAARFRSRELWDTLDFPEMGHNDPNMKYAKGRIIELGAGSGQYLTDFLRRFEGWEGIHVDLPDAVESAAETFYSSLCPKVLNRIQFFPGNLYDREFLHRLIHRFTPRCHSSNNHRPQLLLLSNFLHCHGVSENRLILSALRSISTVNTMLVIHDFYYGENGFSTFYDLHMLANTWNGRIYSPKEVKELADQAGFTFKRQITLESGSSALIFQ